MQSLKRRLDKLEKEIIYYPDRTILFAQSHLDGSFRFQGETYSTRDQLDKATAVYCEERGMKFDQLWLLKVFKNQVWN